jgi:hypothetical protein
VISNTLTALAVPLGSLRYELEFRGYVAYRISMHDEVEDRGDPGAKIDVCGDLELAPEEEASKWWLNPGLKPLF